VRFPAVIRLIHPAPAVAVTALSAMLALVMAAQNGSVPIARALLVVLSVAGSQVATGALNDWADRERDRAARPEKPIPAGEIRPVVALWVTVGGVALQLAASLPLGPLPTLLGLGALASAAAYDLGLSRTPVSVIPYLVSFGLLPLWIATGIGLPIDRVLPAVPLIAPFAAAAHLANTLRDYDADAAGGSRSLAQLLGRRWGLWAALVLALGTGLAAGGLALAAGRLGAGSVVLGLIGLAAVAQGVRGAGALWYGILAAGVAWAGAWALSTG
jgi:4-hydroxybenzoate polyprenyltransferase